MKNKILIGVVATLFLGFTTINFFRKNKRKKLFARGKILYGKNGYPKVA